MKKSIYLPFLMLFVSLTFSSNSFSQKKYNFTTVPGDPLNARIYTLDNGLKVYMTVNKEEPRIQTYIVARVGSKNDPAETTGLAHYFEHMMFKGTQKIGTTDWEKEKVYINRIDSLFEVYRQETDDSKRAAIYHVIDSLSYIASKLAIPNEYDKLMKAIGSKGTNAFTSNDITAYVEEIPSNQLENWAKIQADRFTSPVLRLFHTELETVYEEYNMSLTNDGRKMYENILKALYPNHPYGQQTTLGRPEHLKNPSMKNIREFFAKYYVPNNMAIVLSGDFDPDKTIAILDKYFGKMQMAKVVPLSYKPESPMTEPKIVEIKGKEADEVAIAFRFGGSKSDDSKYCNIISRILSNGKAGLIDLNINQPQKTLSAYAYYMELTDYGALVLGGKPKEGQTIEQVKDLLLEQVELLKKGQFEDWVIEAAINNYKYSEYKTYETNRGRAMAMVRNFGAGLDWSHQVNWIKSLSQLNKKELMDFITKRLQNDYVIIYKRQGKIDEPKVKKPPITPIYVNRDAESEFAKSIKASKPADIAPVFVDFNKEITKFNVGNVPVMYIENTENPTFELRFYFEMGSQHNLMFDLLANYFDYLKTSKHSAAQIKQELYKLASTIYLSVQGKEMSVVINGLSDNLEKTLTLLEEIFADAQPDDEAYKNMVVDILKQRKDAKLNQRYSFQALSNYAIYGKLNPSNYLLSEEKLKSIKAQELIDVLKQLFTYEHKILFYGSVKADKLKEILKIHKTPATFTKAPEPVKFTEQETNENRVFFSHYDANQAYIQSIIRGDKFDKNNYAITNLYNSYFGGSMNAIVFQELREKRSLAYSAQSVYRLPSDLESYGLNTSFIATQSDKMLDAMNAFEELFNDMPSSETSFSLAKESALSSIRTERITKMNIINTYIRQKKLGIDYDIRKDMFEQMQKLTLEDVKQFNQKYIKNKTKSYVILCRENELDEKALGKFGTLKKLSSEEVFGY